MTLTVEPFSTSRPASAQFGLALPAVTTYELQTRLVKAQQSQPANRALPVLDQLTRDNQLLTQADFAKTGIAMIVFSVLSEVFFPVTLAVMGTGLWRSWQQSNWFNAAMNQRVSKALEHPGKPLKQSTIETLKSHQPSLRKQSVWDLALYEPRDEKERVHYVRALKHFGLTQTNNAIMFASGAISFFKRQYRPITIPLLLAGFTTETWYLDRKRRQIHEGWIGYLREQEHASRH
jgi:hypothetical protein